MTLPTGTRSVSALALSPDGKYLAASDMSDNCLIYLFDLNQMVKKNDVVGKCALIQKKESNKKHIFAIKWNPLDPSEFVSAGDKHLYFWNIKTASKNSIELTG